MNETSPYVKRIATAIPGRKFDRLRAKTNMRKAGIRKFCKHDHVGMFKHEMSVVESYFAKHWREYTDIPVIDLRRKKK